MTYDFYNSDIIDQYINKLLPEEIQLKMKASIEQDEKLAFAVHVHLIAINAVKKKAENDLRKQISAFHASMKEEAFISGNQPISESKTKVRSITTLMFKVAAAAVLIIICTILFLQKGHHDDLYAQHFDFYQDKISMEIKTLDSMRKIQTDNSAEALLLAMQAYQQQDFEKSTALLQEGIDKPTETYNKANLQFYLALSHMQTNEIERSILYFQKALAAANFEFKSDAHWYLGLAYLKNNQPEKALETFKNINKGPRKKAVDRIIKQLKSLSD